MDIAYLLTQKPSGSNISQVAHQCRALLQACLQVSSLKEDEWAENRLAEFSLWAANSGVFAGDKASLDSRLALQQDIKSIILGLLTVLAESLIQCQYYGPDPTVPSAEDQDLSLTESDEDRDKTDEDEDGQQTASSPVLADPIARGFSPWSDDSSTESDSDSEDELPPLTEHSLFQVAKTEVAQVIDHLARLSVAIRKSGTKSRSHKADRRFDPEAHSGLRRHLNFVVLAKGSEEGRTSYDVDPNSLTPVQERLILANLRRRNRFLYAQRHSRKLALEAPTDDAQPEVPLEGDWPVLVETNEGEEEAKEDRNEEPLPMSSEAVTDLPSLPIAEPQVEPQAPVLTATSASAATQPIDPVFVHNVTPSQVAKTNITATTAKVTYPRPPLVLEGMRYFKCPCCCQALPEMYLQSSLWKKHLMADICPYTCIIEDCPTPEQLFVTRSEWIRHVERDHQQCWQCFPCTTSGKAPLLFPSVEGFLDHLRQVHDETIKEEQYSTIVPEASRPVPAGISCCPLCDSTGPADSALLLDHIAEHVHAFALRSLPWPRSDLVYRDLGVDGDGDDDDDDDDYFMYNDYFNQGSDIESRADNPNDDSDRDSEGLPSLHSGQSSTRPKTPSDVGSMIEQEDHITSVTPPEDRPIIPFTYDIAKGIPIELENSQDSLPEVLEGPVTTPGTSNIHPFTLRNLQRLYDLMSQRSAGHPISFQQSVFDTLSGIEVSQLLPEVAEGDWPQLCDVILADDYDPELRAQSERLLLLMSSNYRRRVDRYKFEEQQMEQEMAAQPQPQDSPRRAIGDLSYLAQSRLYRAEGNLDMAIKAGIAAIDLLKDEIGHLHHHRLECLGKIADMYKDNGQLDEATVLLISETGMAIELMDDEWNIGNREILLDGTKELAEILGAHDLWNDAEQLQTRVIRFLAEDARFGEHDDFTHRAIVQLAETCEKRGLWGQASELYNRVVRSNTYAPKPDHEREIEMKARLSSALWKEGMNRQRAVQLLEEVVEQQKQELPTGVTGTLVSMNRLCEMHVELGELPKAIKVRTDEVTIRRRYYGDEGHSTAVCVIDLASLYEKSGKDREAAKTRELAHWLLNPDNRSGRAPELPRLPGTPSQISRLSNRLRFWRGSDKPK